MLMERELSYLGGVLTSPKRPFVAILGGSKISGKIDVIESLLTKVDALLVGGAMVAHGIESAKSARAVAKDAIGPNDAMLDIGPKTAESYSRAIASAETVL